jgi:hypothetical protein
MKPIEFNKDYYIDGDRVIFTPEFHINRGSCCGNGCRHCPYEPRATHGNTILNPTYDNRNTERPDSGSEAPVLPA